MKAWSSAWPWGGKAGESCWYGQRCSHTNPLAPPILLIDCISISIPTLVHPRELVVQVTEDSPSHLCDSSPTHPDLRQPGPRAFPASRSDADHLEPWHDAGCRGSQLPSPPYALFAHPHTVEPLIAQALPTVHPSGHLLAREHLHLPGPERSPRRNFSGCGRRTPRLGDHAS